MLCKYKLRMPLQLGISWSSASLGIGYIQSFLVLMQFLCRVNLDHCFHLLYMVNAACIYFLPISVSAQRGWSVYTSTTGWKWVSACLIKSIMLPQTSYPLKQLREAWNLSGRSKLCPSECGWSFLQFQVWCHNCLCWHNWEDAVTLSCSSGGGVGWDRTPWSWCCGTMMLLYTWRYEATAFVLTLGGCTEVMLPERSVLFPVRGIVCSF